MKCHYYNHRECLNKDDCRHKGIVRWIGAIGYVCKVKGRLDADKISAKEKK